MKAYKGFKKDLTCLGYQFKEGTVNRTSEANCRQNGFHCAENPLDCLTYYGDWKNSIYYIVEAVGDIDEDGEDSKISCTEMILKKKMSLSDFVFESIVYLVKHPLLEWNSRVDKEKATAQNGFSIVRGKKPVASGMPGTILGIVKEYPDTEHVSEITIIEIDGADYKPDTWYNVQGQEVNR